MYNCLCHTTLAREQPHKLVCPPNDNMRTIGSDVSLSSPLSGS